MTSRWLCSALFLFAFPALAARPYRGGAVATAYPAASQAALEMLDRGGNAVDAAVAAAFVAGVVGPYHNGIGGGGLALVYRAAARETLALDFREQAPAGASRDMYLRNGEVVPNASTDGGLSVAVPAAAQGYLALLERAGTLKPAAVLAPAIRIAQRGFWVAPKYLDLAAPRLACLRHDPEAARLFLRPGPDGAPGLPPLGTVIRQPQLAHTLEQLARAGAAAITTGRIASAIIETVRRDGGMVTREDLADYRVVWRKPLAGSYRGHPLAVFPPPSAGGIAELQVLGILAQRRSDGYVRRAPADLHLYIEALRRAYVDRARFLGDPDQVDVPVQRLVSSQHLADLAGSIDPAHATPSSTFLPKNAVLSPGTTVRDAGPEPKHTTHISVIDRNGNAVALTTTLNYGFGSCLVARGTGILLNDQMDDFTAKPFSPNAYGLITGEANAIAPGKRPLSSMSPTLVFQKEHPERVLLAVGSPGGGTIPTTVLQVLTNVIDAHLDLPRAVAAGRVHHQWLPDAVLVDVESVEPATRAALEAMGHHFEVWRGALGDAEAVLQDPITGLRFSASDPRNEGAALGQD